jgi:hypothetical protein
LFGSGQSHIDAEGVSRQPFYFRHHPHVAGDLLQAGAAERDNAGTPHEIVR